MSSRLQQQKIGELLGGKYRILRFLAAGGMGAVYEAQHVVVKRRFAVKLLHPELALARESLARFQREAQAAGALESENVMATVDFGIAPDGSPYLVMEYREGESLRALLEREGRLAPGRAADVVLQACRGVQAAHRAGIIHRDLNPQNLLVCRRDDGTDLVKVLDFGIAKLEAVESAETRTGSILGTPAYLSPEQARGERSVDHRADIYGLGAILYETLAGQKPHPGDSHNAILHHICTQPARPLASLQPDLPPALVATVERALDSRPQARQASAQALAEELEPWAKRDVWPASGQGLASPAAEPVIAKLAALSPVMLQGSGRRRVRGIAVAVTVAIALTVLTLVLVRRATTTSGPFIQSRPLDPKTLFFIPLPNPGAIQQIADLTRAQRLQEAAAITAMVSTPQAVWFTRGSPEEVQSAANGAIARAAHDQTLPVLVAYNRPYRDCAGYGVGGASDVATYAAWIDGLARGIGNERAILLLEPDSIGILPYNTTLDGKSEWCRPTVTDGQGKPIPAPDATAASIYALSNRAVDSVRQHAPSTWIYLDATHSNWLPVSEAAYRLVKSGVQRTQGFSINTANFQATWQGIYYGTWISKCIYYATRLAERAGNEPDYRACASQPMAALPTDRSAWLQVDQWYVDHVDHSPRPPAGPDVLAHFVIDTGRNGTGSLDTAVYLQAPYHQPEAVANGLRSGAWCNPPGTGLGPRPTADTGVPLLDAYLWIKTVGESDGSCDIAGGARAWDYAKYNPWGIAGDAQNRFDPLWGMVDPSAGTWFPDQALQLAKNAQPSLLP